MQIELERKNGIPLYIQVKEQLKKLIYSGQLTVGTRLPTERDLAVDLSVSRNTVSMAYKELEAEGSIVSYQGRGTFVADMDSRVRHESRKDRVLTIVDDAFERASELGFSIDDVMAIATTRARERKSFFSHVRLVFIECNREQVEYFSKELELSSSVSVVPIVLDDLKSNPARYEAVLDACDLVITTFFHLSEVKSILGGREIDILGVALDPQLDTIVKIARLPRGETIGLICISENFSEKVQTSIRDSGINYLNLTATISRDPTELSRLLERVTTVIVSPGRKREVEALSAGRSLDIIEFIYRPDVGSINMIKVALMGLKNRGALAEQRN